MISMDTKNTWSLFLDRDGVINQRIPHDYVKNWSEFQFLPGVLEVWPQFSSWFQHIFVVTNQQGIGKGLMTEEDLALVHQQLKDQVEKVGGQLDALYYCPELSQHNPPCRKPNIGMAEQAKRDFPTVDFSRSVMVGDSVSDMQFAWRAGMKSVFVTTKEGELECLQKEAYSVDLVLSALSELPQILPPISL